MSVPSLFRICQGSSGARSNAQPARPPSRRRGLARRRRTVSKEGIGASLRGQRSRRAGRGQQRLRQARGRRGKGSGLREDADRGGEGRADRHATEREGQGGAVGHGAQGRPDGSRRQTQRGRAGAHLVQGRPALLAGAKRVSWGRSTQTCGRENRG